MSLAQLSSLPVAVIQNLQLTNPVFQSASLSTDGSGNVIASEGAYNGPNYAAISNCPITGLTDESIVSVDYQNRLVHIFINFVGTLPGSITGEFCTIAGTPNGSDTALPTPKLLSSNDNYYMVRLASCSTAGTVQQIYDAIAFANTNNILIELIGTQNLGTGEGYVNGTLIYAF